MSKLKNLKGDDRRMERKKRFFTKGGYVIKFKKDYAVKGFGVLLDNLNGSQIGAFPNDTYVVGPEHLKLLKKAKVPYQIVKE